MRSQRNDKITKNDVYEVSFRYKKLGLWKKLWDNDVFAVRLSSGEIGYISVMGKNGEYCALGLYIGDDGFQSYRLIMSGREGAIGSSFKEHELLLQQKCLQMDLEGKADLPDEELQEVREYVRLHSINLKGKNAFPHLIRYEPNYHPWQITEKRDIASLYDALNIANEIAILLKSRSPRELAILPIDESTSQVPLFEIKENDLICAGTIALPKEPDQKHYEEVLLQDDILAAKIKRLPKKGIWEAEIVRSMIATQDEPGQVPYYPLMLLMVDKHKDRVFPIPLMMGRDKQPENLVQDLSNALIEYRSAPIEIRSRDERTHAFLSDVCKKAGIKERQFNGHMETLDAVEEDMLLNFSITEDNSDDDLLEHFRFILELPDDAFQMMSPQDIKELKHLLHLSIIPDELVRKIEKKMERLL